MGARRITRYKVMETMTVTDETLEQLINDGVARGWVLDGIQFAMRDSSKRPAMAFVLFTRSEQDDQEEENEENENPVETQDSSPANAENQG